MSQLDFEEFYRSSKDPCLRAVLAALGGERHTAEDLVAEAFARAWTAWPKVSRHPAPRGWVVRTALNARVSWWRRHRREVAWDEARDVEPAAPGQGALVDPALLRMLRQLPARQREVIALRVFLDLDTAATARLLGIAPGTVTAHLARAAATLRAQLVSAEHIDDARRDEE